MLILSGPAGIGKTLLLKMLATRLDMRLSCVYIPFPDLSVRGLSEWVLETLGKPRGSDPTAALAREAESHRRQGAEILLLIDDALRLPARTAQALAEWTRAEESGLRLVLAMDETYAQTPLLQTLGCGATRVALEARLSPVEAATLVRAELDRTRAAPEIRARFDAAALATLYEASGGVPARLLQEAAQYLPRCEQLHLAPVEAPAATAADQREVAAMPPLEWGIEPAAHRHARVRIPTPALWAALGVAAGVAIVVGWEALRDPPTPRASVPVAALPPVAAPRASAPLPEPPPAAVALPAPPPLPRAPVRAASGEERVNEAESRVAAVQTRPIAPAKPALPQPQPIVIEGVIASGSWLTAALRERGVPNAISALIARELDSLFDFRLSQPGQRFRLARAADGQLLAFDYIIAPGESVHLRREDGRYVARRGEGVVGVESPTRSRESDRRD